MTDDSAMVVRFGNRRYLRVTDVLKPEFWGAVGDGVADDTEAWKKCLAFYANSSKIGKIYAENQYLISSTLHYNTSTIRGVGLVIEGSHREKSGFYTYNIDGALFMIDGNENNTPGNTTYHNGYNLNLSKFFIKRSSASATGTVTGILISSQKDFRFADLYIFALSGHGIDVSAVGFSDYGESSNGLFERVWVDGCSGNGFNAAVGAGTQYVGGHYIFRFCSFFYNNIGMYAESGDQFTVDNCQVVGNNVRGIHIASTISTYRLVIISHNELGNTNHEASIQIDAAVNAVIEGNRFINNTGELTEKQIILGKADGSGGVRNVIIQDNYVVQSDPNFNPTQHYFLFLHPFSYGNVTVKDNHFAEFQSGTKYNDVSRIDVLKEIDPNTKNVIALRESHRGTIYLTLDENSANPTNLTPDPVKNYRVRFNGNSVLNIAVPTAVAYEEQEFSIALWNTSATPITVSINLSGYNYSQPLVLPSGQYRGFIAKFKYLTGYWWQVQ